MQADFQKVSGSGWRLGLKTLFRREIGQWLQARRWLVQFLLWLLILNGFLIMVLFVLPNIAAAEGEAAVQNPGVEGTIGFFGLGGLALSIGIIILTQNELIGEKQTGTAEWVLSKPVARSAFFLSKLLANILGMLVILVGLQSAVAYLLVTLFSRVDLSLPRFLIGMGMLALHIFFYLTLTMFLGVVAESREVVLGVSLGTLLLGMVIRDFIGPVALLTPWLLSDLAGIVALGEPLTLEIWLPILSTIFLSITLIATALWRFQKHEF